MEGLMRFDASDSGIEELPDSVGQLINLTDLNLSNCKSLTSLPDSICNLKLLQTLNLLNCSKLERLPEQLGEMISLKSIYADGTEIQDVPNSISNLTSLVHLYLPNGDIFTTNLPPDSVKDMNKLESLWLGCNIRLWLPMILSLTSLKTLTLSDEGKSLSSAKWFMNLSKLSNLEKLTLDNWGSSYLKLPLNVRELQLRNNATVEQLPDLSNLGQLWKLEINNCISLQSLPSLPLSLKDLSLCNNATVEWLPDLSNMEHLRRLHIKNCIGLQSLPSLTLNLKDLSVDVPDLSLLKKLRRLRIHTSSNLESFDLKERCLEVQHLPDILSIAHLRNMEIPECFDFKSNGSKICFNIPSSGAKYLGIALGVVYKYKKPKYSSGFIIIEAAATNKRYERIITEENIMDWFIEGDAVGVGYKVEFISRDRILALIKCGDRIEVAIRMSDPASKVLMCGAHIITPETTSSISSLPHDPLYQ